MEKHCTSSSATREDAPDNWPEVIKNSKLIAREPIQKYQLNMAKDVLKEDGLVMRQRFGRKDPKKRNRTLLLVGEVGSGKSTLINMMVNNMLGVKWEDNIRFMVVPVEGRGPQTESQTTAITVYEIFGQEELTVPFSLTVIDTPGFADTRGQVQDENIATNLYELLSSFTGVQEIDAVCFVVRASQVRLTPCQLYIFDAILSLFGKNMEKNIVPLITFSDWTPPSGALNALAECGVPCAKDGNNDPLHFLFNNFPLEKPKKYEKQYKDGWDNGTESFSEFVQALDEMETQSLRMTEYVLKERQRLEASVQSLESQVEKEEKKKKELGEAEKFEMKTDFIIKKIENYATCCNICKVNCHYPGCWRTTSLSWCSVMSKDGCTVCPQKCSVKDHKKEKEIYVKQTRKVFGNQKDEKEALTNIANLQQELTVIKAEKSKLMEQAYQYSIKLKEIALKFDTDSTQKNIRKLIEILKEDNKAEKVNELQKMLEKTSGDSSE